MSQIMKTLALIVEKLLARLNFQREFTELRNDTKRQTGQIKTV